MEPTGVVAEASTNGCHFAMIAVCAGSAVSAVWSTRWFIEVLRSRRTSLLRRSRTRSVSVTTRPKDEAEVTMRGSAGRVGDVADVRLVGVAGDDGVDLGVEGLGDRDDRPGDAGALLSRCRRLEPALVQQHDDRLHALRLAARGRPRWRSPPRRGSRWPAMPAWATSVGVPSRVIPMKPTLTPSTCLDPVRRQRACRRCRLDDVRGEPLEVGAGIGARPRARSSRPGWQPPFCIRSSSVTPSSNSWLPTLDTSRPIAFSDSTAGSSWNRPERRASRR